MSTNAKLNATLAFDKGEQRVREWAAQFGPVVQYLEPHFTLFYGGKAFAPNWGAFLEPYARPSQPLWTEKPVPVGLKLFPNPKKGYHALAVEYRWTAARALNTAVAGHNELNTPDSNLQKGFNGPRFAAHVTLAYLDSAAAPDLAEIEARAPSLDLFDVTVKGLRLEFDLKPQV